MSRETWFRLVFGWLVWWLCASCGLAWCLLIFGYLCVSVRVCVSISRRTCNGNVTTNCTSSLIRQSIRIQNWLRSQMKFAHISGSRATWLRIKTLFSIFILLSLSVSHGSNSFAFLLGLRTLHTCRFVLWTCFELDHRTAHLDQIVTFRLVHDLNVLTFIKSS